MKKGFTLIELLSVIVILAVIALIVTPIIFGIIETTQKEAVKSNFNSYLDAVELYMSTAELKNVPVLECNKRYNLTKTTETEEQSYQALNDLVDIKGNKPSGEDDYIILSDNYKIMEGKLTYNQYVVIIHEGENNILKFNPTSKDDIETIIITKEDKELYVGGFNQLTVTTITNENEIGNDTLTWTSSNNNIATVSSTGLVTGVATGVVTITVTSSNGVETSKELTVKMPICKRASLEDLHKEICLREDNDGCRSAGYSLNSEIVYGNETVIREKLISGDAFDCDVDGNGSFDNDERFYYVTRLNDNDKYAVLIYYKNISTNRIAYDSTGNNWNGPLTAMTVLPTINDWTNVNLVSVPRKILTENEKNLTAGGNLPTNFSYINSNVSYAARLLTFNEVESACDKEIGLYMTGELDNCKYLIENTIFSSSSSDNSGYWLETPRDSSTNIAWSVNGNGRSVYDYYVADTSYYGVRPVIEVPISKIAY